MTDTQIREMIMDLASVIDYDASKYYDPATSEDPEEAEAEMVTLCSIVRRHMDGPRSRV